MLWAMKFMLWHSISSYRASTLIHHLLQGVGTVVKPWNVQVQLYSLLNGSHYPRKVGQRYNHITLNIWPPTSPDLNPQNYYIWDIIEKVTNQWPHSSKSSLKAVIMDMTGHVNKNHLLQMWSHFSDCIEAEGSFIE